MSVERWAWDPIPINVVLAALLGLLATTSGSLGVKVAARKSRPKR